MQRRERGQCRSGKEAVLFEKGVSKLRILHPMHEPVSHVPYKAQIFLQTEVPRIFFFSFFAQSHSPSKWNRNTGCLIKLAYFNNEALQRQEIHLLL